MSRTPALAALGVIVALAATACAGSDPGEAPAAATQPPATEAATATPRPPPPLHPTPRNLLPRIPPPPAPPPPNPPPPRLPPRSRTRKATSAPRSSLSSAPTPSPPSTIPASISAEEADEQLRPIDLVIGVSVDGEHRAYGAAFLSGHEIVNDTLGGRAIAVTW